MKGSLMLGPVPFVALGRGLQALPVVHGSAEMTVLVRRAFLERPPAAVALEFPSSLKSALRRVVPHADTYPVIRRSGDFPSFLVVEPLEPLVEALRSAHEADIPAFCIDIALSIPGILREPFPDTYALLQYPLDQLYKQYRKQSQAADVDLIDAVREFKMAERLRHVVSLVDGNVLLVCGIRHLPGIERLMALDEPGFEKARDELFRLVSPHEAVDSLTAELQAAMAMEEEPMDLMPGGMEELPSEVELTSLSEDSGEVLDQPAYYNRKWLEARRSVAAMRGFDRIVLQRRVYRESREIYERESSEWIPPQKEKLFFRFARNWALLHRRLLPDPYRLIVAARAFVNDNFARIFYDVLMRIHKEGPSPFPEIKLTLDDLYRDSRLIRFRLKLNQRPRVAPPRIRKGLRRERFPGEWKESWNGGGMCSYPPEDMTIEDFGRYLQTKAVTLLKSSEVRTLPFTSSLLDGIDYRETIRNAWQDRIFVKEIRRLGSDAGSVVVIYSEDEGAHPWKVVWWGEHSQESDMAFYATPLLSLVVGPGISRCVYGGFLLSYPPGRLGDIWSDPYFDQFPSASERLLAAGILYNEKNVVVHVSARPPSAKMTALAGRFGQRIAHFPLSSVNPVQLNRVRRFHVLDSKDRRGDAGEFIW